VHRRRLRSAWSGIRLRQLRRTRCSVFSTRELARAIATRGLTVRNLPAKRSRMKARSAVAVLALLGASLVFGCSDESDDDSGSGGSAGSGASGGSLGGSAGAGGSGDKAGSGGAAGSLGGGTGGGGTAGAGGSGGKAGSGGGNSPPPDIDPSTLVSDLSDSQKAELCDWSVELRGGYGVTVDCGNQIMESTYMSQAQCLAAEFHGQCELTVGQWEACYVALVPSGGCKYPPECEVVYDC
jgi:hypothetical protein